MSSMRALLRQVDENSADWKPGDLLMWAEDQDQQGPLFPLTRIDEYERVFWQEEMCGKEAMTRAQNMRRVTFVHPLEEALHWCEEAFAQISFFTEQGQCRYRVKPSGFPLVERGDLLEAIEAARAFVANSEAERSRYQADHPPVKWPEPARRAKTAEEKSGVINRFYHVWMQYPDLRWSQLLLSLWPADRDLFSAEDLDVIEVLEQVAAERAGAVVAPPQKQPWLKATGKYPRLKTAARQIAYELGGCAYFVGSALTSETRPRDVDVRVVLPDAVFQERFGLTPERWQWEGSTCQWSDARQSWRDQQRGYGEKLADACGERTVDLGIIPAMLWNAIYAQAPHEQWGEWKAEWGKPAESPAEKEPDRPNGLLGDEAKAPTPVGRDLGPNLQIHEINIIPAEEALPQCRITEVREQDHA